MKSKRLSGGSKQNLRRVYAPQPRGVQPGRNQIKFDTPKPLRETLAVAASPRRSDDVERILASGATVRASQGTSRGSVQGVSPRPGGQPKFQVISSRGSARVLKSSPGGQPIQGVRPSFKSLGGPARSQDFPLTGGGIQLAVNEGMLLGKLVVR